MSRARYVATLRAVYDADDEVEAIFIADKIKENGGVDLDEEEGDTLEVTQVTNNSLDISPEETLAHLRLSRDLLIRTRIKQCYELARQIDEMAYALEHRRDPDFDLSGYDYSEMLEITERILSEGKEDGRSTA